MSVLVEPLAADPSKVAEFLSKSLYPALDGTDEAAREEQDSIMDMFGGLESIRAQQTSQRTTPG